MKRKIFTVCLMIALVVFALAITVSASTIYKDADGNIYDYGYGLNWSGVISDWRTEKYKKH